MKILGIAALYILVCYPVCQTYNTPYGVQTSCQTVCVEQ
jgi:hypothetical protein